MALSSFMFFQDLLFRKSQKENKQWIWESFAFFFDNVYKTEIILHSDENFYSIFRKFQFNNFYQKVIIIYHVTMK